MNNIDLKAQFSSNDFFRPESKNDLKKNLVTSFENKNAQLDLAKESEKEKLLKKKKKLQQEKKATSNENKSIVQDNALFDKLKKLMNII